MMPVFQPVGLAEGIVGKRESMKAESMKDSCSDTEGEFIILFLYQCNVTLLLVYQSTFLLLDLFFGNSGLWKILSTDLTQVLCKHSIGKSVPK